MNLANYLEEKWNSPDWFEDEKHPKDCSINFLYFHAIWDRVDKELKKCDYMPYKNPLFKFFPQYSDACSLNNIQYSEYEAIEEYDEIINTLVPDYQYYKKDKEYFNHIGLIRFIFNGNLIFNAIASLYDSKQKDLIRSFRDIGVSRYDADHINILLSKNSKTYLKKEFIPIYLRLIEFIVNTTRHIHYEALKNPIKTNNDYMKTKAINICKMMNIDNMTGFYNELSSYAYRIFTIEKVYTSGNFNLYNILNVLSKEPLFNSYSKSWNCQTSWKFTELIMQNVADFNDFNMYYKCLMILSHYCFDDDMDEFTKKTSAKLIIKLCAFLKKFNNDYCIVIMRYVFLSCRATQEENRLYLNPACYNLLKIIMIIIMDEIVLKKKPKEYFLKKYGITTRKFNSLIKNDIFFINHIIKYILLKGIDADEVRKRLKFANKSDFERIILTKMRGAKLI